jgi:hypothetical protein
MAMPTTIPNSQDGRTDWSSLHGGPEAAVLRAVHGPNVEAAGCEPTSGSC